MKEKFDYYDIVAITIPGMIFIILLQYAVGVSPVDIVDNMMKLELGGALMMIVSCFFFGEFVQTMAKIVIEKPVWFIFAGKPTTWISTEKHSRDILRKLSPLSIDEESIASIKQKLGDKEVLTREQLELSFRKIKNTCFRNETCKREAERLLAKANMLRALLFLSIPFCFYFYYYNLDKTFTDNIFSIIEYIILIPTIIIISFIRYVSVSVTYAQVLLVEYASSCETSINNMKHRPRALGSDDLHI